MANLTDALSDEDWHEARSWVDRLKQDPENHGLLTEFETWLGEVPARAGAYRKVLDTLELLPLLREQPSDRGDDHCPNLKHSPDKT